VHLILRQLLELRLDASTCCCVAVHRVGVAAVHVADAGRAVYLARGRRGAGSRRRRRAWAQQSTVPLQNAPWPGAGHLHPAEVRVSGCRSNPVPRSSRRRWRTARWALEPHIPHTWVRPLAGEAPGSRWRCCSSGPTARRCSSAGTSPLGQVRPPAAVGGGLATACRSCRRLRRFWSMLLQDQGPRSSCRRNWQPVAVRFGRCRAGRCRWCRTTPWQQPRPPDLPLGRAHPAVAEVHGHVLSGWLTPSLVVAARSLARDKAATARRRRAGRVRGRRLGRVFIGCSILLWRTIYETGAAVFPCYIDPGDRGSPGSASGSERSPPLSGVSFHRAPLTPCSDCSVPTGRGKSTTLRIRGRIPRRQRRQGWRSAGHGRRARFAGPRRARGRLPPGGCAVGRRRCGSTNT